MGHPCPETQMEERKKNPSKKGEIIKKKLDVHHFTRSLLQTWWSKTNVMMMRRRERKAAWLIMIDSFRALSSPPSLPLSLWLDYGDVFSLSSPHPILLSRSLQFFLRISVAFPCASLFIHPLEKEAVNLTPAPPCPLTHRTSLHLSPHSSISLSYPSLSLFFSSLSFIHSCQFGTLFFV